MNIHFEKANLTHKQIIFNWLDEPHVQEFWDNSPGHREDIEIFANGRVVESIYFGGSNSYWVGFLDDKAYCLVMTHEEDNSSKYSSKTGKTFGLDFCIGDKNHLGKGLAALSLKAFMKFFVERIDKKTDMFLIDPYLNNPRAIHVYKKAGFKVIDNFIQEGGFFDGSKGVMMAKKM